MGDGGTRRPGRGTLRRPHPAGEAEGPAVRLEAHRAALLEDGLVRGVQPLAHGWCRLLVADLLVVVGLLLTVVVALLPVSKQVRMKISGGWNVKNSILQGYGEVHKYDATKALNTSFVTF